MSQPAWKIPAFGVENLMKNLIVMSVLIRRVTLTYIPQIQDQCPADKEGETRSRSLCWHILWVLPHKRGIILWYRWCLPAEYKQQVPAGSSIHWYLKDDYCKRQKLKQHRSKGTYRRMCNMPNQCRIRLISRQGNGITSKLFGLGDQER